MIQGPTSMCGLNAKLDIGLIGETTQLPSDAVNFKVGVNGFREAFFRQIFELLKGGESFANKKIPFVFNLVTRFRRELERLERGNNCVGFWL